MKIIVTGGAGFIGSNFVFHMLNKYPDYRIICLDCLTYAGNLSTLRACYGQPEFPFCKGEHYGPRGCIYNLFEEEKPDMVVNFAAESHVDRSIENPEVFLDTNIKGTAVLMDACRKYGIKRYHQVSTDEVYGDLPLRPTGSVLHGGDADPHQQPLQFLQGRRRSSGAGLPQNLRPAGDYQPLFQQLRSLSFPGEADSADDRQRPERQAASGIRKRRKCPRLALCGGPLQGH